MEQRTTGRGVAGRPGPSEDIDLYSTPDGTRAVGNPVRRMILAALREREYTFEEIVALAGRAKSTVSVHLQDLAAAGVIGSRADPADARRKIFFLAGDLVASVSPEERVSDALAAYAGAYQAGSGNPFAFYNLIFRFYICHCTISVKQTFFKSIFWYCFVIQVISPFLLIISFTQCCNYAFKGFLPRMFIYYFQ